MSSPAPLSASPRSRARTALRWTGRGVAGVAGLLVLTAAGGYGASAWRGRARHAVPAHAFAVPNDDAAAERGARLARVRGCADCHGPALAGRVMIDDPVVGRIGAPNLTSGRPEGPLTDADWERAVRHGVRRDGRSLLFMPSYEFAGLTDEDLGAIAAYARRLPGVAAAVPATRPGPLLRGLDLAGQAKLYVAAHVDHARPHRARLTPEPTAAYGAYMAEGCVGCHGEKFSGGPIPGAPPSWRPAANLTPAGIGRYREADLARVLRTGYRPDGSRVQPPMTWEFTQAMTDVEIAALYAYLRTLPARAYGNR